MTTPSQTQQTKTIDEYSFAAKPALFCFANEGVGLGTVFFWQADDCTYLITNWHNVTGLNPLTGANMHSGGGRPTRLEVSFLKSDNTANYHLQSYRLYANGVPLWRVHRRHGSLVDVVALPLQVPTGFNPHPINRLTSAPLKVRVGHDLFVLGFPFSRSIFDRGGLPIWKRASLASEPDWVMASELFSLLDTASRPGMSGSPVIRRAYSGAEMESGEINLGGASRFYGVYAGRIASNDPNDAQLGRVFERKLLEEIISDGIRDPVTQMPPEPSFTEELVSLRRLQGAPSLQL